MTSYEIAQMLETMESDYELRQRFERVLERTHDYDRLEHRMQTVETELHAVLLRLSKLELGEVDVVERAPV